MDLKDDEAVPIYCSPLLKESTDNEKDEYEQESKSVDASLVFRKHETSQPSELFYDLFAVASLSAFTTFHQNQNGLSIEDYLGYITLLWITWYQVAVFDARFAWDSLLERFLKIIQFGVMVGFAWAAVSFNPSYAQLDQQISRDQRTQNAVMAFALFLSRFTLACQYAVTGWNVRQRRMALESYKKSERLLQPQQGLFLTAGLTIVFSLVYLATFLAYVCRNAARHTYIVWYVFGVLECVAIMWPSLHYKDLGFSNTHFIERLSLLPLFVLGEGVIAVMIAVKGSWNSSWFVPDFVMGSASGVLFLYLAFILYADIRPEAGRFWRVPRCFDAPARWPSKLPRTFRNWLQGNGRNFLYIFWALLHFPFCLALVLASSGNAYMVRTHFVIVTINQMFDKFNSLFPAVAAGQPGAYSNFTDFVTNFAGHYNNSGVTIFSSRSLMRDLESLQPLPNQTETIDTEYRIQLLLINTIFRNYEISPADLDWKIGDDRYLAICERFIELSQFLNLVFIYFTISSGLVLIFLGLLRVISRTQQIPRPHWTVHWAFEQLRTGAFFLFGAILCALASLQSQLNRRSCDSRPGLDSSLLLDILGSSPAAKMMVNGWLSPTAMFCYLLTFIVVQLAHRSEGWLRRRRNRKTTHEKEDQPEETEGLTKQSSEYSSTTNGQGWSRSQTI